MEQKGSFIGFTFGNRHSSKLGILRTSKSDRYDIHLLPQIKDTTVSLDGVDGAQYWGSSYSQKEIPISFAFYGLTDEQLQQLKRVFNDKKIHDLILDEEPYKVWSAKLTGIAMVKHLCFESEGKRFYCGEGKFTFTAYQPYARSRYQYIEDYTELTVPEWNEDNKYLRDEFEEGIIYPAIMIYELELLTSPTIEIADSTLNIYDEEGPATSYDILVDGEIVATVKKEQAVDTILNGILDEGSAKIIALEGSFSQWLNEMDLLVDSDLSLQGINSYVKVFTEPSIYYNLMEWAEASQIPSQEEYGGYNDGAYRLYNAGDIEMPFKLYLKIGSTPQTFNVHCGDRNFLLNEVIAKRDKTTQVYDTYIMIDTQSCIVCGCDNNKKPTKNLYNEYLTLGNFFQLPRGTCDLYAPEGVLEFNYLYL